MKLSVLMPVKDEGINLALILKILGAVVEVPHEILVVYDSPDDDSLPVVRSLQGRHPALRLVHNTRGPGVANALLAGAAEAAGEYVLIFAVDDTGPALAIDQMLALMDRGCDLVSCTRYARGGRRLGGSVIGGLLSRAANWAFRHATRTPLTDATTGIKMMRREVFEQIALEPGSAGWSVAFELAIKAQLAGLRVGEVPIVSIDRLFGGRSTFALVPWFAAYLKWFLWAVGEFRRVQPARQPLMTCEAAASPMREMEHVPV